MIVDVKQYLDNFYRGTKNPSLHAMEYFMQCYQYFEKEMKFFHIAGTNGKGSCTEMISNILKYQGYRVGKFMSPHLIQYNERISINGRLISDEELSDLIEELQPKIDTYNKTHEIPITLFELETIMALLYFKKNHVDFAVLETGLGGLYDCTNIITSPLVSIITSIGFDHTHILGDTLPKIAYQKAGIIKENSHTVFLKQTEEVTKVLIDTCKQKNNTLHLITKEQIKNHHYDKSFQYFDFGSMKNIAINLKGASQIYNASLCMESMNILNNLGYSVSEGSMRRGLMNVVHKGRMEPLHQNPLIIFDGAHNEPAIKNLQHTIDMYYKNKKRLYIISILKRKDYESMLKILLEDKNATFVVTSGNDSKRYVSGQDLYQIASRYLSSGQKLYAENLENALDLAKTNSSEWVTFVVGSFYVYDTVVKKINEKNERKSKYY